MINLETLNQIISSTDIVERTQIIEKQIFHQNGYKSFQSPSSISDALAYIWDDNHKWQTISSKMLGTPEANDVKTQLNNIILRRNQIVHEGDCLSDTVPLERQIIEDEDVDSTITFIKDLTKSIYDCIAIV